MDIASVPVIMTVVYGFVSIYKDLVNGKAEICMKLIPLIACLLGIGLGVLGFYLAPGVIPAEDLLTAIMIGAASGLGATGANQVFKQFLKK